MDSLDGSKKSPLEHAVDNNDEDMTEFLIDLGANIEQEFSDGAKPLKKCIFQENLSLITLFVNRGADISPESWDFAEENWEIK